MNRARTLQGLWAAAAAVVLAAAALSLRLWWRWDDAAARLTRKQREIVRLHDLESRLAQFEAARSVFEDLPAPRPTPLAELLRETLAETEAEDVRETRRDAGEGWVVWQKEIAFREVPLDRLVGFLDRAAAGRPPWRLVKCSIKSSARAPGAGQVVVTLEALEKTAAGR